MLNLSKIALMLFLFLSFDNAFASDYVEGRVLVLEPTYMPNRVSFSISVDTPNCVAGSLLFWQNSDLSNNRAVYATLLTAITAKKIVRVFMKDGCEVGYIHLLDRESA